MSNETFEGAEEEQVKKDSPLNLVTNEVIAKPPRIILHAGEGKGKSSWAASAQKAGRHPIIIPTEDGVNQIKCPKFPQAESVQEVNGYLDSLINEQHAYDFVIIDTLDWLEKMIWIDVCRKAGVKAIGDIDHGKGYARTNHGWEGILYRLDQLVEKGIGIILLAHTGIRSITPPTGGAYDVYSPKLYVNGKGVGALMTLTEWADCVLYCEKQEFFKKEDQGFGRKRNIATGVGERIIHTEGQAGFMAKNRYRLPAVIKQGQNEEADFGIFWGEFCNSPIFK